MQSLNVVGPALFAVGIVWLAVSILRLISKSSRASARQSIKYSLLTIVGSLAIGIYASANSAGTQPQPAVAISQADPVDADPTQDQDPLADLTPVPELTPEEIAAQEEAEREAAIRAASNWRVARGQSSIDDSPIVEISVGSNNNLPARFGSRGPATLSLRCQENTTSATIRLNGHFMADIQNYGRVTYRVDDRQAKTIRMQESTNNEWLGLWRGGQSIPFIRELIDADRLVIRATPFNENPMEATFTITGLDHHLPELRRACNW